MTIMPFMFKRPTVYTPEDMTQRIHQLEDVVTALSNEVAKLGKEAGKGIMVVGYTPPTDGPIKLQFTWVPEVKEEPAKPSIFGIDL